MAAENLLDVWIADLDALDLDSADPLALLGDEEFARFSRLRPGKEQTRYLVSRLLLRRALSEGGAGARRFDIAHAGDAVAVAVSTSGGVGVDLERFERPALLGAAQGLSDSVFSERELDALEESPPATRWQDSLRFWSVKEAYAKLQGIAGDLDAFDEIEVEPAPWRVRRFGVELPSANLHLEGQDLTVGDSRYHLALAAAKPARAGARVHLIESLRFLLAGSVG